MDRYSTHMEHIRKIYSLIEKPKYVVEFGCGNYSTEFLINNSGRGISIEMQSSDWYNNIKNKFKYHSHWEFAEAIGPWEFSDSLFKENIDLSFVDGHGDTRPECINLMMEKGCPIIISHDTEEPCYGWERVETNNEYKRLDFKKYHPWTTLWTTDINLLNNIK
jgi:hypothetical protein